MLEDVLSLLVLLEVPDELSADELEELLLRMQNDDELPETFASFKERYFDFYDDGKDKSLKKQYW